MVKKDLGALWKRKGIRSLLMLTPVVLLMAAPLVYSVVISLLPVPAGSRVPQAVLSLLDSPEGLSYRQAWFSAFTTLICPILFLSVPVICSVSCASLAFLGEKEAGTLETVLLSSMSARALYCSKIFGCSVLSVFLSLISFLVFALTVSVADIVLLAPFFLNLNWLILVVLLMPALAFFSAVFVSLVTDRVASVGEGLQMMGYLLLPFLVLFLIQLTGTIKLSPLFLLGLSAFLWILSIIFFNLSMRKFVPQRLLQGAGREEV